MNISPETMAVLAQWGPLLIIVLVFYFMLLRPQRKEQQKRAQMLSSLKKGDRVVTIGGMLGTITALTDKTVTLRVTEKVEIEFSRDAISRYQNPQKNEAVKNAKPEKGNTAKTSDKNVDKKQAESNADSVAEVKPEAKDEQNQA